MAIETITKFFMWCSIINVGLLVLWSLFFVFASDFVYRLQSRWFPIPRENYNVVIYVLIGLFKFLIIIFNLVPYIALRIIG
jgi:hypothetical protein